MTTFNISRNNEQANSNVLLIGIALVAIVAVIVAFAPALFSSSTVAVEGAPFGNNSNDGNFTVTTKDDVRIEGTSPNLNMWPNYSENSIFIDSPGLSLTIDCDTDSVEGLDAAGNAVLVDAGGVKIAYSSSDDLYFVTEKDVVFVIDGATCEVTKVLLPS